MAKVKFWSRVGHWFTGSPRVPESVHQDTPIASSGSGSDHKAEPPRRHEILTAGKATGAVSRLRLSQTGADSDRLEEEYARVVGLMDAIQEHLASQAQRSEAMAQSLDRVAKNLEEMPQTSRKHLELLSAINEVVEAGAESTKRVEEGLLQLPQLADAQREAMVSIGRQMDLSRQANDRIAETMEGFQHAITRLSETTTASSKALQDMRWDATAREERVASLLQEQTRWLTIFASSAIGLALVAVAAGLIALLR